MESTLTTLWPWLWHHQTHVASHKHTHACTHFECVFENIGQNSLNLFHSYFYLFIYILTSTENLYHFFAVFCPKPKFIEHGQVLKKANDRRFAFKIYIKSIRHGDKLEYECNDGYRLEGPSGATCVNGEWQPPLSSSCVEAIHPPFGKMWKPIPNMND